jgi:two-component system, NarL family, sensor histidine kinase DevS
VGLTSVGARSGLENVAVRAHDLGGEVELGTGPLGGVRLTWSVPLSR